MISEYIETMDEKEKDKFVEDYFTDIIDSIICGEYYRPGVGDMDDWIIAYLLIKGVLLVSECDDPSKVQLSIICNDTFGYASADCEDISMNELEDLYKEMKTDQYATEKYCIRKRNMKPLPEVIKSMKKYGSWNDEMENIGKK